MAYWATQAQIEEACGGASRLVKLAGATNTADSRYAEFIEICQAPANAYIRSLIAKVIDPDDASIAADALLADHEATLTAKLAYRKGTGGQAMPDQLKASVDEFEKWETRVDGGKIAFSSQTAQATNAGVKMVTTDTTGTRVTRRNMGGFC